LLINLNLENSNKIQELVKEALTKGVSASEIIENGLRVGLDRVGEKYENGEYFLSELLFASTLMKESLETLAPAMIGQSLKKIGKIVLGTVRGDIHDIGKNIFKTLATSAGFEIYDLDVDVEPRRFIEKLKETNAEILAMSTLLTTCLPEVTNVIEEVKKAGIRDRIKIILGGNAVTEDFAKETGADAAARSAVEGVNICKEWIFHEKK